MSYSEETKWHSQLLLNYKDNKFNSNGHLRLFLSISTSDYDSYSPPNLLLSIKNNLNKSISISFSNSIDLIETIEEIFKTASINGSGLQIDRRYSKNEKLYLSFYKISDERVVKIIIQGSETDLVSIVVPLKPIFVSFMKCIKNFSENYFKLCQDFLLKSIENRYFKLVEQIPVLIKNLPSNIISNNDGRGSGSPPPGTAGNYISTDIDKMGDYSTTTSLMNDFDNFLGKNIDNIKIPHVEDVIEKATQEKIPLEIKSDFVKKMLLNDLENLEILMNNIKMSQTPVIEFAERVKKGVDYKDEEFSLFLGISDDDLKTINYLSTLFYRETELAFLTKGNSIPLQTVILRYNPTEFSEKIINIAYDLYLISIFMKIFRIRMEMKTVDPNLNGSIFYFQLRCFTDPFIYSFIDRVDSDKFKSLILNRFEDYIKIGFFNKYNKRCLEHNLSIITSHDILSEIELSIEKVIGKMGFANELHKHIYDSKQCVLPAKNTFTLEQIIKDVIPVEVSVKLGKSIKDFNKDEISEDVYKLFVEERSPKNLGDERKSNIQRYILDFKDMIPNEYFDKLYEEVKQLTEARFDFFKEIEIPLNTLSENIIKALYVWDPVKDKKMVSNYKYFCQKIDDEIMTKDLILTKEKQTSNSFTDFDFSKISL